MTHDQREARRIEAKEIAGMLGERVEDLAPILLPDGRRNGIDWREGRHGSKSIRLRGPHRGVYRDFENSDRGTDMLGAVQQLLCNGSMRDAIQWAKQYLQYDGLDTAAIDQAREAARQRRERSEAQAKKRANKRQGQARWLWHKGSPILGSPADHYLVGRGIRIARLGRPPGALRYHAEVWCQTREAHHPAMLAGLWTWGKPELIACHRTYLDVSGLPVGKAPIDSPRSTLGSWPGAIIPIQRGHTGRRWRDMQAGELVAFGEGIEEALSIALVKPEWRVGAVGYVSNFTSITPPVQVDVILCGNNDPADSQAAREIEKAADRLEALGHRVRTARPPAAYKDWNDLLTGKRNDE